MWTICAGHGAAHVAQARSLRAHIFPADAYSFTARQRSLQPPQVRRRTWPHDSRIAQIAWGDRMDQNSIFLPFVAVMLLTLVVWVYMYARRIPFILRSRLTAPQLTPLEFARLAPPQVSNPSDNLKNLFELPTVFYAVVLYLYVAHWVDATYLIAAWMFFGFRVLHSIVHCSFNFVPLRFWLYAISALALWFMVVRIAFTVW